MPIKTNCFLIKETGNCEKQWFLELKKEKFTPKISNRGKTHHHSQLAGQLGFRR
jgi:hypothetical protein